MGLTVFGQDTTSVTISLKQYKMMSTCPIRLESCESKIQLADSLTAICNRSNDLFYEDNKMLSEKLNRTRWAIPKVGVLFFFIGFGSGLIVGLK